jgi:thiol-disulfide isomerase/thioredoxin
VKPPVLIGILFLAAALLGGCGEPGASIREGELAPRFEAVTLSGETFDSRSLDGQVVLLNFWATWCRPCLGEIPILQKVEERPGVRVVGIAIDEQGAGTVAPFVADHDIRYTVVLGDQELFLRFDGFAIPHTVLLDPDHRIARIYRGPVSEEELDRDLAGLLPET